MASWRDERGEAVLEGGGASGEEPAEACAHERDPVGIDLGPPESGVDDRADDRFPVGPERETLVAQDRALPRTVEGDAVVAAAGRGGRGDEVGLLEDGVIAAVVDEGRPRGVRVVGPEEVAGERGSFERDRELFCGWVQQSGGGREAFADTLAEERDLGIVGGVLAEVEVRCSVVVGGAQERLPRGDPVSVAERLLSFGVQALRDLLPVRVPRGLVPIGNLSCRDDHLTEVRTAVAGVAGDP